MGEGPEEQAGKQRRARLDKRERIETQRESAFREREYIAEQFELSKEMGISTEELRGAIRAGGSRASLADREAAARSLAADLADRMAEQAEEFADYLESASARGDRQRRLAVAKTEREIARIERQNATKLRALDDAYELIEHLPKLRGATAMPESSLAGDPPDITA